MYIEFQQLLLLTKKEKCLGMVSVAVTLVLCFSFCSFSWFLLLLLFNCYYYLLLTLYIKI